MSSTDLAADVLGCPTFPDELADDAVAGELIDGPLLHLATLLAHEVGLFERLGAGPLALAELAGALGLAERATAALVAAAASFGLVATSEDDSRVALSPSGRALLLPASPRYVGSLLALGIDFHRRLYHYDRLAAALRGGGPEAPWTETLLTPERAGAFTRGMHAHSVAPAAVWSRGISLVEHDRLLDVGGGAGTHAIAAVAAHPHLEAIVFELPQVCPEAEAEVARSGLGDRVRVVSGDMWTDRWPAADLHLLADVLHDWPPERCRELVARSFGALPPGGRLLIHEMLLDDDRLGPAAVAASDLAMLLVSGGRQYTREELFAMLRAAGFAELRHGHVLGSWHLLSGRRP